MMQAVPICEILKKKKKTFNKKKVMTDRLLTAVQTSVYLIE